MNSRPKPSETEEDILKQQKEFLKNKCKPSVKVVSVDKEDDNEACSEENKDIEESSSNNLMGSIIEKKSLEPDLKNVFPIFSTGFPQAKRRQSGKSSREGSIFSQQSKKLKENTNIKCKNLPGRSFILTGEGSEQIHQENVKTLDKMSEKEILNEQKELMSSLDPGIVKFLKSRRSNISKETDELMEVDTPILEPITNVEDIETPKEILDSSEKWLHFQTVETEKLQWMKSIEIPKCVDQEQYEARFDFGGWLLPYIDSEVTESNRALFHHGEESGRPGYSIKELFKLCRSNVQQQRILSLNTISNIVSLHSTGVYDSVIEIPFEQIFFVVRVCVDDNSPAVLNSCVKAMFNLFYSQIDETCLDSLLGFGLGLIQPRLAVNSTEVGSKEDEREVNDQQLAELDLVRCLVRTDILVRIRYIINTVQPTAETVNYCLNLLIRLMRDSFAITLQVFKSDGLFSSIIKHFIPKIYKLDISDNCYGTPMISAIKLLRITAARSKHLAQELIDRYNILDSIVSYIAIDNISLNIIGIKIQIESFNLLAVLFKYNLCLSTFMDLQPFFIRTLDYHIKNTDILVENTSYLKQNHCAGVFNIIAVISVQDFNLINNFIPLLMQSATKYCTQVSTLTDFKCGNLQLISALFMTITSLIKSSAVTSDFYIEKLVATLLKSPGFGKITEDIKLGSNLLCNYESHKTAANFTTIEAAVWSTSEHVVPCLLTKSCIPFLSAFSYYLASCDNTEVILKFLNHPNIIKYLTELNKSSKYNFTSNWFTKLESQLLLNILRSAVKIQNLLPDSMLYYELSGKCLNVFNAEQKKDIDFILKNVVFNKQFYPQEVLLDNLSLNEKDGVIHNILKHLDEIYECYSETMDLKKIYLKSSTATVDLIGNIIPIDWSYFPIVALYANHTEDTTKEEEVRQILTVTRCLQWIFLYENYFPDLAAFINPTDRFCRLACAFLISNTLFLEKDVHDLLSYCLKALVKPEVFRKLNFDKEIQGLNNFQDFYVQLLEQYQGVSYGDVIFANFVMIPLIQSQNMKWRKILWSEYLGVAQTITLNQEQCLINVQEFLNPPETDLSLLKCYRRALVSNQLQRSPLLQHIANFHVENYVRNRNKS